MTTAPALQPTAPLLGDWQPLPTAGAVTPEPVEQPSTDAPDPKKPFLNRLAAAGHWVRDTGLGIAGFLLVLIVAGAGWTASFIGLHDFGMQHMHLSDNEAWLVPLTFDGAPAGLSLVVFRASINGRAAGLWRVLIIVFTGLSSWINYQHIDDSTGRYIASLMPPAAVLLFEGLMSEARAAATKRAGRERPRVHPMRWVIDRPGTWSLYRAYVLGLELPEQYRIAAETETETAGPAVSAETNGEVSPTPTERPTETAVSPVSTRETRETETRSPAEETTVSAETVSTETNTETETRDHPPVSPRSRRPARSETSTVSAIGDRETETNTLVSLMKSRGGHMAVSLNDAIETTGRPKATAAKRLKSARDLYLAETA